MMLPHSTSINFLKELYSCERVMKEKVFSFDDYFIISHSLFSQLCIDYCQVKMIYSDYNNQHMHSSGRFKRRNIQWLIYQPPWALLMRCNVIHKLLSSCEKNSPHKYQNEVWTICMLIYQPAHIEHHPLPFEDHQSLTLAVKPSEPSCHQHASVLYFPCRTAEPQCQLALCSVDWQQYHREQHCNQHWKIAEK